jgi:hypothetical protein
MERKVQVSRRELIAVSAAIGLAAGVPAHGSIADPERLQPKFRRRALDK